MGTQSLLEKIDILLNSLNSAFIFIGESNLISRLFSEIKDQLLKSTTELNDEVSFQIFEKLKSLISEFSKFGQQGWKSSIFEVNITELIEEINELTTQTIELFSKGGIKLTEEYDLTTEVPNDLRSLHGLLANPSELTNTQVQNKIKEIEDYFEEIDQSLVLTASSSISMGSPSIDISIEPAINSEDSDEFNIEKLKLDPEDVQIFNGRRIGGNSRYQIYYGKVKSISLDVSVTVINESDSEKRQRLLQILCAIHHPFLESFVGYIDDGNQFSIVTRRNGEYLSSVIERHRPKKLEIIQTDDTNSSQIRFKSGVRTIIAYKIASAMAYVHSNKIIHRDLCSANITIDKSFKPRIINFANSRFLPEDQLCMSIRPSTSTVFRAPELFTEEIYDQSVDVFSFGTILYEMLTGTQPFYDKKKEDIENLIIDSQRPNFPQGTPKNLADLISKCWAQEGTNRPTFIQIMDEMVNNEISFPSDENAEILRKFYDMRKIKNKDLTECLDLFIQISEEINNSHVYRQQGIRIRSTLYVYQNLLHSSEYATLDDNKDPKISSHFTNLKNYLKDLLDTFGKTERRSFLNCALNEPIDTIYKLFNQSMELIFNEMKELGFSVKKYESNNNDILFDFRFIYSKFSRRLNDENDEKKKAAMEEKMKEIEKFLNDRGMNIVIYKEDLDELTKDLFASFPQFYIKRSDLKQKKPPRVLGNGLSCKVFLGDYTPERIQVAIKEYKMDYFQNNDIDLTCLRREISLLAKANHPYVVKFIGYNNDKDYNIWIAMRNEKKGALINSITKLTPFDKTKIVFEIAEGMEYLHSLRIIHRDLKSQNILLNSNNDPIITDFGLSRTETTLFKSTNIGTPGYQSPEILSNQYYSYPTDVFSFGLIVWELYYNINSKNYCAPFSWIPYNELSEANINGELLKFDEEKIISQDLKQLIIDATNSDQFSRPTFTNIIERMLEKHIAFNGANPRQVSEFYKKKAAEREMMINEPVTTDSTETSLMEID